MPLLFLFVFGCLVILMIKIDTIGDVLLFGMKVKGNLRKERQEVRGDLYQSSKEYVVKFYDLDLFFTLKKADNKRTNPRGEKYSNKSIIKIDGKHF